MKFKSSQKRPRNNHLVHFTKVKSNSDIYSAWVSSRFQKKFGLRKTKLVLNYLDLDLNNTVVIS